MDSGFFDQPTEIEREQVSEQVRQTTAAEAATLDTDSQVLNLKYWSQEKEAYIKRYKKEHKVRIQLIYQLLALTIIWMSFIATIILGVGWGSLKYSDGVMIAIITTLTTEVLGFFYLVLKYLYNEKHIDKNNSPEAKQ